MELLQRQVDERKELGVFFVLRKDGRRAVCRLLTHAKGWELRLKVASVPSLSQRAVCETDDELFSIATHWTNTLRRRGWI